MIVCSSCVDTIDLASPSGQSDAIVVQGRMIQSENPFIEVSVSKIFAFDGSGTYVNVSGVQLISESEESVPLDKISDGNYYLNLSVGDLIIDFTARYKIRVVMFDDRIIESEYEELKTAFASDEITFSIQDKEIYNDRTNRIDIRRKAILNMTSRVQDIQKSDGRLLWGVSRYYKLRDSPLAYGIVDFDPSFPEGFRESSICYIREEVAQSNLPLFDGSETEVDEIEFSTEIFEGTINDYRYADTMYFIVTRQVLSEGAFTYFNQIDALKNRTGSMFEAPAGQVISNLQDITNSENSVYGYFYMTNQSEERVLVLPEMLGSDKPPPLCPVPPGEGWRSGQCPFQDCCDCLSIANSSYEKPDFWIE